jgi:hypothetical protein
MNADDTDQEESGDREKAKSLKHRGKEEAEEIGKRQNLPRMIADWRGRFCRCPMQSFDGMNDRSIDFTPVIIPVR